MRFVDPKNDAAFKKIFGNKEKKEILISFLNAVLGLEGEQEIHTIESINPHYLKPSLLDVKAKDKRCATFIIRIVKARLAENKSRLQYYAAKAYLSQIEHETNNSVLNPVLLIALLEHNIFENEEDQASYLSHHLFLNERTKKQQLKGLEFYFIELPKFTKDESELTSILDKWVYFIKHASNLDVVPESADTEALKSAYEVANCFSWRRDELEAYDYWDMKRQDERGRVQIAEEEARQDAQKEIARSMLAEGLSAEMIARVTPFSIEEITAFART